MKYETVIGIEIHCELKTKTKAFSGVPTSFGEAANTRVDEVDLGHLGTLPCVNKDAVCLAILTTTALKYETDPLVKLDRKNYYYSDLPKGFQITQQFHPVGSNGVITIRTDDGERNIRINRIYMKGDTAKRLHNDTGTLVDYNRTGTLLVEIVSEPDTQSGAEAVAYVEKLRNMPYHFGVSDVEMGEGGMCCDVNVSIRPQGSEAFGAKTGVKDLNSIPNIQKTIDAKVVCQRELLEDGGEVVQAIRRYGETQKTTILMREKEGNADYKFFPEPNIPPIRLNVAWIEDIQDSTEELPDECKTHYIHDCILRKYGADIPVVNRELSDFFDEVCQYAKNHKKAANWAVVEVTAASNRANTKLVDNPCSPRHLANMVNMVGADEISGKQVKIVSEDIMQDKDPKKIVEERDMKQMSDNSELLAMASAVPDSNPQSIEDFRSGRDRAVGLLTGQVMKVSKGQANPAMTNKLIQKELKKCQYSVAPAGDEACEHKARMLYETPVYISQGNFRKSLSVKLSILGNHEKIPAVILAVLRYAGKCAILETQSCNQA